MPYADKAAQRENWKRWYHEQRQALLEAYGPCQRCGSWDNLNFHHREPEHKVTHRILSLPAEQRQAELAKCVCLCAHCHRMEHMAIRRNTREAA